MALTNYERVGKAIALLGDGLAPIVARECMAHFGGDWMTAVQRAEGRAGGQPRDVNPTDAQFLLKAMWDEWNTIFSKKLSSNDRNYVSELRTVRNAWAHNRNFTTDDALRALDTAKRLLESVGSGTQAIAVEKLHQQLLRLKFDEQTRTQTRAFEQRTIAAPSEGASPSGLPGWREVVEPHQDVATGEFQLAEFAADLHQVWRGEALAEYGDPAEFFRRTYITEGLAGLLVGAAQRFGGNGGDPVIQLQTNFGGGKTHALIALYHLAGGTPANQLTGVEQLLAANDLGLPAEPVQRAVLVGHQLKPGEAEEKDDGTVVRTMWGELAHQLGGADGYALVAEADRTGTSPGSALTDLLRSCAPCLVLIDEWVGYARQLYGISGLPAGSFDAHFSFAQALTDAAASVPGALLVATIPSSQIEVGGEGGQAALTRLENLFARTQANWRTATAEESFEIVRRRLFNDLSPEAARRRDAVVKAFAKLYQTSAGDFPLECREGEYQRRMTATYPVHPELFDRLFGEWSALERFQRTRGVLRFMATVVHSLWMSGDPSLLIMPGTIPVDDGDVAEELLRHLDGAWRTVVEADVDGASALPLRIDKENANLARFQATRKVARTVFFGSAPSQKAANRGLDDRSIKLGCVQPGERPASYDDALRKLSDRAMYLYRHGTRYWYALQANVNRTARDRAENHFSDADADDLIRALVGEALRGDRGGFAGVHVCPRTPADVPDEDEVRLVALDPTAPHDTKVERSAALEVAQRILLERSAGDRQRRNMLAFLAADTARVRDLRPAARSFLAWESIDRDKESMHLDEFQTTQISTKLEDASGTVRARVGETYIWALHPRQPSDDPTGDVRWETARLTTAAPLAERVSRRLVQDEALIHTYAGTLLRMDLDRVPLWQSGPDGAEAAAVSVGQLWEHFTRYLYLPRLVRVSVLQEAIRSGVASTSWSIDGFAYADGHDGERYVGLRAGEQLASIAFSGLVVHPDVAAAQIAAEQAASLNRDTPSLSPDEPSWRSEEPSPDPNIKPPEPPPTPAPTRYFGRVTLDSDRWTRIAAELAAGIVQPLARTDGAQVKVTIEVSATAASGFDDALQADIAENANSLDFDTTSFNP